MPTPIFIPVRTRAERAVFGVIKRDIKDQAEEVLGRPDAWRPEPITGRETFDPMSLTPEERGNQALVAEVQRLAEERQRSRMPVTREPLRPVFETARRVGGGAITGAEAIAETGLAATQRGLTMGPRFPTPFRRWLAPGEESVERSKESLREVGALLTGKAGFKETVGGLAERQRERPLVEQFAAGAIFDPLNLLPGVGFGPEIVRGLRVLKGAGREAVEGAIRNAPRTAEGIRAALSRLGDRMPEVKRLLAEEGGFARLGGEAGEEGARFTPFVQGANIDELSWAKGAMSTHLLAQSNMATTAPRLTQKNFQAAVRILRAAKNDQEAQKLLREIRDPSTLKQDAAMAAREREGRIFKETEEKFAEERAATETISEREARRRAEVAKPAAVPVAPRRPRRPRAAAPEPALEAVAEERLIVRKVPHPAGFDRPYYRVFRERDGRMMAGAESREAALAEGRKAVSLFREHPEWDVPAPEAVVPVAERVPSRKAEAERIDEALKAMEVERPAFGAAPQRGETQLQFIKRRLAEAQEEARSLGFALDVPKTRAALLREFRQAEAVGGVVRKEAAEDIAAAPPPAAQAAGEAAPAPGRTPRVRRTLPPQGAPGAAPVEAAGVQPPSPAAAPPPVPPRRRPPVRRQPSLPPPEEPFAANIRLSKYPEDIRGAISDWAAENAPTVQEARRGLRSDAQVLADAKALVEEMGGDFARVQRRWKPGEAWNAEEVTAIRGVLRQRTQAVLDAAKASRASNSDENLSNLMIALKEQSRVQEIVHGVTAEAGRSLRAFRQAAQEMAGGRELARFEELLKRLGGRENLSKWAALISTLDVNDPVAINNFIRATQQPKLWDYLSEYFINSILSGPATHARNILGNTGALLTQLPERGLAAGVERVLAPIQGRQVERFWEEVPAAAIGALRGLDEGTRGMLQVLKTGQRLQDATKIEILEFRPRAFTGPLGRVINAPTNAMEAADAFFYSVNFRAALESNIVRQAQSEGMKGQALISRIAELKSSPTQDLLERAVKEAETRLFRNDPGPFVQELMRLRGKFPALRFVVPFVRTPANLITFGLARSPAGFLNPGMYRNLAAKNPQASDQIARALMGSMVAGAIAWQFTQGNITAQAPSSAAERDRFYREGKQPWSIRVLGHWISYRDFEPFSITFGLISSAMTAIDEVGEGAVDATTVVGRAVTEMGRFLLDRSFFTGLADTLNAVQEPERYGSKWLLRMAGAAVPFSALLRQIAQTADPTFRKAQGVIESLEANLPGLTAKVPGRVTALGETPRRPSPALFPVQVSPSQQSDIDAELERLGMEIGFVGKSIAGVELTRSQQRQYQVLAGQETMDALTTLIASSGYQSAPDDWKETLIERNINAARERARAIMQSDVLPPPPTRQRIRVRRKKRERIPVRERVPVEAR